MAEHLLAAVLLVFVGLVLSFLPGYGYRTRQEADSGDDRLSRRPALRSLPSAGRRCASGSRTGR